MRSSSSIRSRNLPMTSSFWQGRVSAELSDVRSLWLEVGGEMGQNADEGTLPVPRRVSDGAPQFSGNWFTSLHREAVSFNARTPSQEPVGTAHGAPMTPSQAAKLPADLDPPGPQ